MLRPMLSLQQSPPLFSEELSFLLSWPIPHSLFLQLEYSSAPSQSLGGTDSILLPSMLFRRPLSTLLSPLYNKDTVYLATIPFHGHCLFREVSLYIQTLDSLDLGIRSVEGQNILGDEGENIALIIKCICFTSENETGLARLANQKF